MALVFYRDIGECVDYYTDINNFAAQQEIHNLLEKFQKRSLRSKKCYFKVRIPRVLPTLHLYLMFWAPEGYTRPHEHLYPDTHTGAPATIYVVRGDLVQQHFSLEEATYRLLSTSDYWVDGEAIEEDAQALHRIGNSSLQHWAVSIHEFVPGFRMRVYEFYLNKKWIVSGRKDTLGPPPENAEPIWLI